MEIIFSPKAQQDLRHWKSSGNVRVQKKILELLNVISLTPFTGIGKPEALKYDYSGCWSRRIDEEHRLIYEVEDGIINILSLKDHYQ
jgi:toxin YoeB